MPVCTVLTNGPKLQGMRPGSDLTFHFFRSRAWLLLLCLLPFAAVGAEPSYDFNSGCREAYAKILQWRFAEAAALLDAEHKRDPENLIPAFLENYLDFFTLFFNEDPADYKRIEPRWERRQAMLDKGPSDSPFYLYCRAVMHFQWAAVSIKFGHNWDAGWEFRRSFLQFRDNREKFPHFTPNEMYYGALQVAVGTIPDGYRWLSHLLGLQGSIHEGMFRLRSFLNRKDEDALLFHQEAAFFYCYLEFYIENKKDEVFDFIREDGLDTRNSHLFAYLAANLSLNNQQSDQAIRYILGRNRDAGYFDTPIWDFELAYAKLHHLDADAGPYFERFLDRFRGRFYVKDALQKLSWYYYLRGEQARAGYYRSQILRRGSADTEADKQALKEARSGQWPDPTLLRARLLDDGGYFREALRLLQGKTYTDFTLPAEQVEFSYRAGRLFDDLGNKEEALRFYAETIRLGAGLREYYAARAALQAGQIYEQRGDKQSALQWFQRCLDMKDHDYKNALDQRAKAGIARCRGE